MNRIVYRLTPRKPLTLNNRWYEPIRPKHTLFFLPANADQLVKWNKFLCETHHKSYLFLHEVHLDIIRYTSRILTYYRGEPLYEILVRDTNMLSVHGVKVMKVFPRDKLNLRYFPHYYEILRGEQNPRYVPRK